MSKKIIAGLLPEEMIAEIVQLGESTYRARQVMEWVFKKHVLSFSEMTNLPAVLRHRLAECMQPVSLSRKEKYTSKDGSAKYIFITDDGQIVESVFIPVPGRATVCLSSQVGCAFGCVFCASGSHGLVRNLRADEIVGQLLCIKQDNPGAAITNVVMMGMGEPLANYDNSLKAVRIINHPDEIGLAARKITISTCGLPEPILRLSREGIQFELSISLHAADERRRDELMPVNKKHPLSELIKTAKEYTQLTGRIITFEYVLIDGINAGTADAEKLAALLGGLKCKVNLIPFNSVPGGKFIGASPEQAEAFAAVLERNRVHCTIRRSRGADIQGACGQLRAQLLGLSPQ